jgi:hypothetical protein
MSFWDGNFLFGVEGSNYGAAGSNYAGTVTTTPETVITTVVTVLATPVTVLTTPVIAAKVQPITSVMAKITTMMVVITAGITVVITTGIRGYMKPIGYTICSRYLLSFLKYNHTVFFQMFLTQEELVKWVSTRGREKGWVINTG